MKTMIKPAIALFFAVMLCSPGLVLAQTTTTDLIAGQHVDVGEVQVWKEGNTLFVKYIIDADLTPDDPTDDGVPTLITQTHLAVATDPDDLPQTKKGNPIPGQFENVGVHDPGVTEYTYKIPLLNGYSPLYIAAHAVVEKLSGLGGLELALPDTVQMSVEYPGTASGDPSYFDTTIWDGRPLDGTYDGWCIDIGHTINPGATYTANVYSSYGDLPDNINIDKPENLDLVNYIINHYTAGDASSAGGVYTICDIQKAIWTVIDTEVADCGGYSQGRVDEIVADAEKNGKGFVPACGDVVAIILDVVDEPDDQHQQVTIAQVTFAEVGVPCATADETAWGAGTDFDGKNWATYFIHL